MTKLAIITTHPIQYHAPMFAMLAARKKVQIKIFYTWGKSVLKNKFDPGFGKIIHWDIPLLDGYEHEFVKNTSNQPGSHHFNGIVNPTLIQDIKKWNANAVLVFGWNFNSHLKSLCYFHKKIPVFFRGDSTLIDDEHISLLKKISKFVLLRWVYKHIDRALYVGQANKEYFIKYGLKSGQLVFAPHATDNERFMAGIQNDMRTKFNIPSSIVIFLFTGKLEKKKDPFLLLNAFVKLNDPKANLVFVGNGELEDLLKTEVKKLLPGISSHINFMDFQNQTIMPGVYKSADVLVLPSRGPGETWGLSVNEAMAVGKAVLVSDKCGCSRDLVEEGKNGYVFAGNDMEGLTAAMKKIMADSHNLRTMGEYSKKIIKNWSYEKICGVIEHLLEH